MKFSSDLMRSKVIRWLVKLHPLQFLFILPVLGVIVLAGITMVTGVKDPGFNFGLVITWVVWWGLLIALFIVFGRGWCFMCPFGAVIDWIQRRSLWWKTGWTLGLNFKYPKKLQNQWLGIALFVGFIFMDAGYGISNSPTLTAGLVAVLFLGAMWTSLLYERRIFCRYLCPLTVFIGMSSMLAPFEIRRKDAEVCRSCRTKDCYRGNEQYYGCPTFQFQGGELESNSDCILCTECIKACPYDNVAPKLRWWGRDLWARKNGRLDESVAAVVLASLVTMVSFILVLFLPKLYLIMRPILPAGVPPNDWPRLVSIIIVYLGGITVSVLLMFLFSCLSKLFSGAKNISAGTFFTNFGYALIPLAVLKFLSDILDHVFRTWGAFGDAAKALRNDFPQNRMMLSHISVTQLMSVEQTYWLQVIMIAIGLAFGLFIARKTAGRMFPSDRRSAFRAFLPMGIFIYVLAVAAVWTLSATL